MTTSIDAQKALHAIDPVSYAKQRNYIGMGTGISPYITRGILTLPQVRDYILQTHTLSQSYKFVFELAWREYWQREWKYRGTDEMLSDIKRPQEPVASQDMPQAVCNAATGITSLDTAIKDLYETGYMHNHARMWIAGLVCNIARTHWREPSRWLYYHLLDGDPASNTLSWQWVAGTFSSKKYLPAQSNINTYTNSKQQHTYLDYDYALLAGRDIPAELLKRTALTLVTNLPKSDTLAIDPTKPTLLYHSFWLNKDWYPDLDANRVLLLEPSWFEAWPVSDRVMKFILDAVSEIEGIQIVVAEYDVNDYGSGVRFMKHPSITHWKGEGEDYELLFPAVPERSYSSFMSFWKQAEKSLK